MKGFLVGVFLGVSILASTHGEIPRFWLSWFTSSFGGSMGILAYWALAALLGFVAFDNLRHGATLGRINGGISAAFCVALLSAGLS
jgi:hypothetical protein